MPSSSTHKLNDLPILSADEDLLGLTPYAEALAKFIARCETPMTIGIQGEWGTGKTSMMEMVKDQLRRTEVARGRGHKKALGDEAFTLISINTWEHSLINDPTGCLLSITEEIITELSKIENSLNLVQAKQTIMRMAKGAASVSAVITGGSAESLADVFSSPPNDIKALREQLKRAVLKLIDGGRSKIIIFIDDLDRLDPSTAVKTLELLSNLFAVEHCVFVIAIDYQVVVKGLKEKYGDPKASNEHEFRSFFDKLIQLPFMMPISNYQINDYTMALLKGISYFSASDLRAIHDGRLQVILNSTIGVNPRSIKRLTNSLEYLKLFNEEVFQEKNINDFKHAVFALVCFQISFPNVYSLLRLNHAFEDWDGDFVDQVVGKGTAKEASLNDEAERILQDDDILFNDDWEKAVFKIVWMKNWQRSRLRDVSTVLNFISDDLFRDESKSEKLKQLKKALDITAVTAVNPTDELSLGREKKESADNETREKLDFWRSFTAHFRGSNTCFDHNIEPIKDVYITPRLGRTWTLENGVELEFMAYTTSTNPLVIRASNSGAYKLLHEFTKTSYFRALPRSSVQRKLVDMESEKVAEISLSCPDVPKKMGLQRARYQEEREKMLSWLRTELEVIQDVLDKISID